jgi:hypothetical protein
MTDIQHALSLILMLKRNGFGVSIQDFHGNDVTIEDCFKYEKHISFHLLDSHKKPFCTFDFNPDGSFYRISGTDFYWMVWR